jgi:Uma2 family endonuclease
MNTLQDIKQAIERLSPAERESIATWIGELEDPGRHVAETAVKYGTAPEHGFLSVEEYLKLEAESRTRHEYIAGEIFAMTGVSREHNLIAVNVLTAFSNHLRGGPCKTFMSDFKVRLRNNTTEAFYYPDVMVACEREGIEKHYLRNPKLIVEVLSPSTESVDRREKMVYYRRISTLEEYVLIAQDTPEVTICRRSASWEPSIVTAVDATGEFRSIDLSLPLAHIYDGVL